MKIFAGIDCNFAALMKSGIHILLATTLLAAAPALAQTYAPVKTNWDHAGHVGAKPIFTQTVDIRAKGADNTGSASCNAALAAAINALNGKPGVIYFPAGTYFFNAPINVSRDSIVFRGAGHDSSRLRFDLQGSITNLINVTGAVGADTAALSAPAIRGAASVAVSNASAFHAGDWVRLTMADAAYMTSTWAYGSLSQMLQVQSVSGNTITFRSLFRFNYVLANAPAIRRVYPRNNVGFECLAIQRSDATAGQASNIAFDYTANCWVNGIESDSANFAHIEVNHSSNLEVTNSYFHDALAYGGNGQGYGVLLQFGSGECKVESNYFRHLRHSMILQAGANGNVLAYNYSTNPYWTEPGLPDSSAGEIVLHGNFPFMNLAEGNVINNIVIDDSHGKNGPLNTFFRNRARGYGLFMNFNPATDSQQFIGNEITNAAIGLNFIQGKGHLLWGNNYLGTITSGSSAIPEASFYLPADSMPPCPDGYDGWPVIGRANSYNTGAIYAETRVRQGFPAACACVAAAPHHAGVSSTATTEATGDIFPNPATGYFFVQSAVSPERVEVYNESGMRVLAVSHPAGNAIDVRHLPAGCYMVRMVWGGRVAVHKLFRM